VEAEALGVRYSLYRNASTFILLSAASFFQRLIEQHIREESDADKAKEKDVCYWASVGDEQKLVSLLESGVSVNWTDSEGRTPLHWVCDRGHEQLLDTLLSPKYSPDLNVQDADGMTPLH